MASSSLKVPVNTQGGLSPPGVKKQRLGTIAVIQIGLFLSATVASMIGGAWQTVMQSDFDVTTEQDLLKISSSSEVDQKLAQQLRINAQSVKSRNLRYAIFVTLIGLIIVIGWTLFVQELDPTLISYVEA